MLKRISSGFGLMWLVIAGMGQGNTEIRQLNHVYSQEGIGIITPNTNVRSQAMGYTGVSSPNVFSINSINPALLTYNNASSLEFGIGTEFRKSTNEFGDVYRDVESGISEFRISAPIKRNKWQTMFGIRPYSQINYFAEFLETLPNFSEDSLYGIESIQGQGGINEVSWKNGIRVARNLNLGLDLTYYFGNAVYHHQNFVQSADSSLNQTIPAYDLSAIYSAIGAQPTEQVTRKNFSGFGANLGVSYYKRFAEQKIDFFLGATYDLSGNINTKVNDRTYTGRFFSDGTPIGDTLESQAALISVPQGWNAGLTVVFRDSVGDQRCLVSLESSSKNYMGYNQSKYGVGFERLADFGEESRLSRMMYRFGGYYSENAVIYQGGINEFGITFGLGIPMKPVRIDPSVRSVLDLGITMGTHGEATNGLVKESFIRANISLTFNDRWFRQIRIN